MIFTVTLSPALDRTLAIAGFQAGRVNRAEDVRLEAGGKGINVSKNLLAMGIPSRVMGFLGGSTGGMVERELRAAGLETDFVQVAGETRINTKVTDPVTGDTTDINEPGPAVSGEDLESLAGKLRGSVHGGDTVVFSGSLPAGAPDDVWRSLVRLCRSKGAKTYLDSSGPALRAGLESSPYLAKPNLEELSFLTGKTPGTVQEVVPDARGVSLESGSTLVVSMGADGALMVRGGQAWYAKAPAVRVRSTVGAGDALLAGLIAAEEIGLEERDMLAFAVAAGSASAVQPGSGAAEMPDILYLADQVQCAPVMG